jgi:hypothetical protein
MMSKVVLVLAGLAGASASYDQIAKYSPLSNVVPHNKVDRSAHGMISALSGKVVEDVYNEQYDAKSTLLGTAAIDLAYDMYTKGGGGSSHYAEYEGSVTASTNSLNSMALAYGTYKCTQTDADATGGANPLVLGKYAGKAALTSASTKLKAYFDDTAAAGYEGCGRVPSSGDVTSTHTAYVTPFTEAACPVNPAGVDGPKTVTCTSGADTVTWTATSIKLGGRTLKGFSTQQPDKMTAEPEWIEFKKFHGADTTAGTMGDETVQMALASMKAGAVQQFANCRATGTNALVPSGVSSAACKAHTSTNTHTQGTVICKDKTTRTAKIPTGDTYAAQVTACTGSNGKVSDFFSATAAFNKEVAKKVAVYSNAWIYTVHEFEDAYNDCNAKDIHDNDAGVHAWDEGVAFYTGSIAGTAGYSGTGDAKYRSGRMIYELANKRCNNFGTCSNFRSGNSNVNIKLFSNFVTGQFACHVGDCAVALSELRDHIIPQMSVPLIQGTLRYAYKMDKLNGGAKECGEGYAFMLSVIHRVNKCNPADAKIIYDAMDIPATVAAGVGLAGTATYTTVKTAFERNYACMGITCADIGELLMDNDVVYDEAAACVDPDPAAAAAATTATTEEKLPTWAIVVIAIAGGLMLIFFGLMCAFKASKDTTVKMYQDLKKEGALGKVEG